MSIHWIYSIKFNHLMNECDLRCSIVSGRYSKNNEKCVFCRNFRTIRTPFLSIFVLFDLSRT